METITTEAARETLCASYSIMVGELANVIRSWPTPATEGHALAMRDAFEAACGSRACATDDAARMVLALTGSWRDAGSGWTHHRFHAAAALALDAAKVAGAGWFLACHGRAQMAA